MLLTHGDSSATHGFGFMMGMKFLHKVTTTFVTLTKILEIGFHSSAGD
jgi:hypothetical protein